MQTTVSMLSQQLRVYKRLTIKTKFWWQIPYNNVSMIYTLTSVQVNISRFSSNSEMNASEFE